MLFFLHHRLKHMHEHLSSALSTPSTPSGSSSKSPWPSTRTLLQIKLLTTLFPVSDRRHPVITPASLLVGYASSICAFLLTRPCVREHVSEEDLF
jgi:nucleolar protein 14